jgi:hypothetical protein
MAAAIGSVHEFSAHVGTPPQLPRPVVEQFTRPGIAGTGVKVHATMAPEFTLQLVAHGAESGRVAEAAAYRSTVGTVQRLRLGGVDYDASGWRFLVLGVEVIESQAIVAFHGRNFSGAAVSYTPAGRIVSAWRLQAVPYP